MLSDATNFVGKKFHVKPKAEGWLDGKWALLAP